MGPEATTERLCVRIFKGKVQHRSHLKGFAIKLSNPFMRHLPDRLFIVPPEHRTDDPVFWFVEFKALGKKPNEGQLEMHERLRALGCRVDVIDDVEDFKRELSVINPDFR